MGLYTFGEFETQVRSITGVMDTTLLPQSEIFRRLNYEYRNALAAHAKVVGKDIPELSAGITKSTTAGVGYVSVVTFMPSGSTADTANTILRVNEVSYEGSPLEHISQEDYNFMGGDTASGQPAYWYVGVSPSVVYLSPVPDAVYSLTFNYTERPAEVTSATFPKTGEMWDDVILWGALKKIGAVLKDWDLVKNARDMHTESLAVALSSLQGPSEVMYHVSAGYTHENE